MSLHPCPCMPQHAELGFRTQATKACQTLRQSPQFATAQSHKRQQREELPRLHAAVMLVSAAHRMILHDAALGRRHAIFNTIWYTSQKVACCRSAHEVGCIHVDSSKILLYLLCKCQVYRCDIQGSSVQI
eukprot:360874-Chlamydomonas_euryale.AAC.12